jgi:hypothetical protein
MGHARRALVFFGLLGVSCSSTCESERSSESGQIGELGNGDFVHGCLDRTDKACLVGAAPDCIATGSRFELNYQLLDPSAISSDDIDPVLQVRAANEDFLSGGGPFLARRDGRAAVIVMESDHVIDLLHLELSDPTGIEIVSEAGEVIEDRLTLARGEAMTLFVHPQVIGCPLVGGAMELSTRSSLGLTRSIVRTTASDVLELQGSAVGTITISVLLGELERTLTIEVVDGPVPGTSTSEDPTTTTGVETATETEPGTSTASATDTDTDTDTGGATGSGTGGG